MLHYRARVACAFFGGLLAAIGVITAAAVILGAHPEGSRWTLSQTAAGVGVGLLAVALVRDSDPPAK